MIKLPQELIDSMEKFRHQVQTMLEKIDALDDPNERAWAFHFFIRSIRGDPPIPKDELN